LSVYFARKEISGIEKSAPYISGSANCIPQSMRTIFSQYWSMSIFFEPISSFQPIGIILVYPSLRVGR
jgi:hypothetical protein